MLAFVWNMNVSVLETNLKARQVLALQLMLNQRELASELGVGLGKVNCCFGALLREDFLKAQNFKNSKKKIAYVYVSTPSKIFACAELKVEFLQVMFIEYTHSELQISCLRDAILRNIGMPQ